MRTLRIEMPRSRVVSVVSGVLASIIVITGCGPTPGFPNGRGTCFQQPYCGGNTLLGLPAERVGLVALRTAA
jgi:hypothetical protein